MDRESFGDDGGSRLVRLVTGPRGGVSIDRRLLPSRDGRVWLEQRFRGDGARTIVTHRASVLAEVAVCEGALSFPLASGEIEAPRRLLLAVPPRSALPLRFEGAWVESRGVAELGAARFDAPLLVAGCSLDEEAPWLAPDAILLDADRAVPVRVRRARQALHDLLMHPAPVGGAARRVGLAGATLVRGFARAYGVSPVQYCQRARVFEAVLRLLSGTRVVEAGLDAGFSDVGRFYAAFRRIVGATPGGYARVKNRQDRGG
jgi:AraC-like DNA-binding protein